MKRTLLTICSAIFLVAAGSHNATAQTSAKKDKKATAAPAPVDSAAMMKAWMDYMTPGEMHQLMNSLNGTWDGDVSHWMAPGAPPEKSKVTSTFTGVFNGLYQESLHKGNMMGMEFEGRGVMGYDNAKKKFVSTWYDNMGSGVMILEGTYDKATKTFHLSGPCTNPLDGKTMTIREAVKIVDNDTQIMEMYGPDPTTGKEYKTMEIVMKRQK